MEGALAGCRLAFNPRYVQAPEQKGLLRHVAALVPLMTVTTATGEIIFPSLPYMHMSHKRTSSLQRAEQGLRAGVKLLCAYIAPPGKRAVIAPKLYTCRSSWIPPGLTSGLPPWPTLWPSLSSQLRETTRGVSVRALAVDTPLPGLSLLPGAPGDRHCLRRRLRSAVLKPHVAAGGKRFHLRGSSG